jgi:hypothetical protein
MNALRAFYERVIDDLDSLVRAVGLKAAAWVNPKTGTKSPLQLP